MARDDRRTRMTKALINESFLELLEQRHLSKITVKDICEGADVNRSTYYRYYSDPFDQIEKMEDTIIEGLCSCLNESGGERHVNHGTLQSSIERLLGYILENKRTFCVLLGDNGGISLQRDILTLFSEKLLPASSSSSDPAMPLQTFIFVSNGSFGLIYYWLVNGIPEPPNELASRIATFVSRFMDSEDH